MARRASRKTQRPPEIVNPPIAEPKPAVRPEALPPRSPLRLSLVILAAFLVLSVVLLVIAWPGYQIKRHTVAAQGALDRHDYAAAVPHLQYIIKEYPTAWERQKQLGNCYLELDRPQEALEAYDASLKEHPEQDLDAKRGRANYLMGKFNDAIALLQKAIEANPNDPFANYYIGLYYMKQQNYPKAAFFFQGATSDEKLFEKVKPHLEEIRKELLK